MYSIDELANDFRKLGIQVGDTVMLHASVRAVGEVAGGPDAIHLALKSVLKTPYFSACRQNMRVKPFSIAEFLPSFGASSAGSLYFLMSVSARFIDTYISCR